MKQRTGWQFIVGLMWLFVSVVSLFFDASTKDYLLTLAAVMGGLLYLFFYWVSLRK